MTEHLAVLVGGPHDGYEIALSTRDDERPPKGLFMVDAVSFPDLLSETPFRKLLYEAQVDTHGFHSRDDQGRWRYRITPA